MTPVGADIPRIDGPAKLDGSARYVDDIALPEVLHAGTVRSPVPRGRIQRIRFDPAIDWSEFTIVDHRDIPGENAVKLIELDQPVLAENEVRHVHEPILLLAHRSIRELRRGLRAVQVEIDPLPALFDPSATPAPELVQHASDNVFKRIDIRKGDPQQAFARAARVVEGEYRTGPQEHVYLETQGMLATCEDGKLVVRGSMQCPYYVLDALTHALARSRDEIRVIQTPVGGGFGGKEDFPSNLAIHAALLAEKSGMPVKLVLERAEDMAVTTKRHPSVVRHRTALDADGRLLAMEIEIVLDGGAYVTLSPVVLSRACIHAAGPYACDNVHIHGEVRLTNSPPYGAFRGFGAPQTLFAVERHMDEIARSLELDPAELRRRNLLRDGQTTATGQVFRDGTDLVALQNRALELGRYQQRRAEHARLNASHAYLRRGTGFATVFHGAGFTGAGEAYLKSEVELEAHADGAVELLTAQTDMGQGTTTILAQIAADRLGVDPLRIRVAAPDTSRVPNSGPTVASRTAMVVGRLVEQACDDLLGRLEMRRGENEADDKNLVSAIRAWHAAHENEKLVGRAKYTKPPAIEWDEQHYRGDAYACYSWATYVAEVEIDLRTCAVRVVDFVALQEIGQVLNPTLARGQIAGGVAQGIGWALYEQIVLHEGAMLNAQMTNYIIPAAADLPPIRVHFEEVPSAYGPRGAKGIGELPMDAPAPALVNAINAALGTSLNELPLTPERLMKHLRDQSAAREGS